MEVVDLNLIFHHVCYCQIHFLGTVRLAVLNRLVACRVPAVRIRVWQSTCY